jgi:hypothetical protein
MAGGGLGAAVGVGLDDTPDPGLWVIAVDPVGVRPLVVCDPAEPAAAVSGCGDVVGPRPAVDVVVVECDRRAGTESPVATSPITTPSTTTTVATASESVRPCTKDASVRRRTIMKAYVPVVRRHGISVASPNVPGGCRYTDRRFRPVLRAWHLGTRRAVPPGASDVEDDVTLEDIEAICRLKYAYFRLLDQKRFTELGALLTDDATTSYQSGEMRQAGRDAIVAFLETSLGDPGFVTMHNGHHPEIDVPGDGTATGRWYLEDRVIVPAHDFELSGTAFYDDRYVKVGDAWRIAHTGYERVFEEHRRYSSGRVLSVRVGSAPPTVFSDA